jgi:hypothetical protein
MFNLDSAIQLWRQGMSAEIKSIEALDELESHLRDEIQRQMQLNVNEQQAFEIAVEKIGQAAVLEQEFAKAIPLTPLSPQFLRTCCIIAAAFVLLINWWTLLEYELSSVARSIGLSLVALIAFYIGGLPYLNRFMLYGLRNAAIAINLICVFGLISWEVLALGSAVKIIHLPEGTLLNVFAWNLFAATAATLLVLWFGRDDSSFEISDWNSFTPMARESLEIAGTEALRFHHDFIGTEHLLLGLIRSETGAVANVMRRLGLDTNNVRAEISKIVGNGPKREVAEKIPFTPRARRALQLAAAEAGKLDNGAVSAEHIFLGLLIEGTGVAGLVLKNLGISADAARAEIMKDFGAAE